MGSATLDLPPTVEVAAPLTQTEYSTLAPTQRPQLVIFDWDGTLVETISGKTFAINPDDYKPLPGRVRYLLHLRRDGLQLAVATNQGGVAFGYHEAYALEKRLCEHAYHWFGIHPSWLRMCPHHPKGTVAFHTCACACRKPQPGMLYSLMEQAGVPPKRVLFVGDMDTDAQAAQNAGVGYVDAAAFFAQAAAETQPRYTHEYRQYDREGKRLS